jgi:hypothetical protein
MLLESREGVGGGGWVEEGGGGGLHQIRDPFHSLICPLDGFQWVVKIGWKVL